MQPPADSQGRLGTFAGVFTPSILTILGIILFRRTGYVVGSAGLAAALGIMLLAIAIAVLTALSLGAISTNLKVKGGGDYYLISRTLGVEFGGAIGIVLFLAQSVSIAFYTMGFGEAMAQLLPWSFPHFPRIIAGLAVLFLFVFAWLGADWATRLQYVVMAMLGLSLLSFLVGGVINFEPQQIARNWFAPADGDSFWFLFALFFPAVTGFTQGVSMSGDLKDPGKSLPLGTFLAIAVAFLVYIGAALLFAGAMTSGELMTDYNAMSRLALWSGLITIGVIGACLSSGMASFLGAPRILQAMAEDRILPRILFFAKGAGAHNNPRRGVVLSLGIALTTVSLGNLDAIAPAVSMFFLTSYGLLNYATYYEARAASPSFRPRFRWFNKHLSLLGGLSCLGAMLAINPVAGLISISLLVAVYQYLKGVDTPARWSHGRRSHDFQRIRELLFEMNGLPPHARDWRPHILAFSRDEHRRNHLLNFASWIEGGSGMTTVVSIIEGVGARAAAEKKEAYESLQAFVDEGKFEAFPLAVTAPDFRSGLRMLLQSYGIGPLKANVVLLNWFEEKPVPAEDGERQQYGRNLREAMRLQSNIAILSAAENDWLQLDQVPSRERRIDVWWGGGASSRLSLLLAYLMTRTPAWDEAQLRILAQGGRKRPERTIEGLQEMLRDVRISAEIQVVEQVDADAVTEYSGDASLVVISMMLSGNQPLLFAGIPVDELLSSLPPTALVIAAEDIDLDAEPEEGEAGEKAAYADRVEDAEKAADQAANEAASAKKVALDKEKLYRKAQEELKVHEEPEALKKLEQEAVDAREDAEAKSRRAVSARQKLSQIRASNPAENPDREDGPGES